jgi:hypothetical protein
LSLSLSLLLVLFLSSFFGKLHETKARQKSQTPLYWYMMHHARTPHAHTSTAACQAEGGLMFENKAASGVYCADIVGSTELKFPLNHHHQRSHSHMATIALGSSWGVSGWWLLVDESCVLSVPVA